jgi:chromosomal replication initiation ATPase DnaA
MREIDERIAALRQVIAEARRAISDLKSLVDRPAANEMHQIAEAVSVETGISLAEMRGPSTSRHIYAARAEAMRRIHATGHYTLKQIGMFFGDRDHATVKHALQAQIREAA